MASVDLPVGDLPVGTKAILSRQGLQALIDVLGARGYRVLGPTLRDGAIVYDDLAGVADLPAGWTDVQQAGQYRLERRADEALFGYAVGPSSWKRFLHPPLERLWQTQRTSNGFTVTPPDTTVPKFAFLGVRACELHAIQIQDTVLKRGPYRDTGYDRRRQDNFLIAVNCGTAGGTCFCVSMKTGPAVDSGFDLALTELLDAGSHRFLVETGSAAGAAVLAELPRQAATPDDCSAAQVVVARTAQHMGRSLDTDGLKQLLQANPDHKRWEAVGERCLSCGNCTMVCPTCFCTAVADHSDLAGETAERVRRWDSCFNPDFSYIHGGTVRTETKSRYRQWITHKLASWIDQFGTAGCVGCGRCMTWCPVGIDITEEARAIRDNPAVAVPQGG
jgi:formate hydrogenlyase subunit 6/NADH:ubiquinone oxidoreductase subunit I